MYSDKSVVWLLDKEHYVALLMCFKKMYFSCGSYKIF